MTIRPQRTCSRQTAYTLSGARTSKKNTTRYRKSKEIRSNKTNTQKTGLAMTQGLFFPIGRWALGRSSPIGFDVRYHLARAFSDRDLHEDPKWRISD